MNFRTDKAARLAAALIAAAAIGAPALAHHAFQAEFDGNQPIMLQGKVTKVEWINPHTWVHMDVLTNGVSQEWMVEAGTPNTLLREGLTRDMKSETAERFFALGFALEQLREHMFEVHRVVGELAKD